MPTLNASIPQFECYVRDAFLYGLDETKRGRTRGVCHGVSCLSGRAIGFHVLLENGAHISRLPIHALTGLGSVEMYVPIDEPWRLQLWDCFSYEFSVTEFDWLSGMRCRVALPDGQVCGGEYLFTIDYFGSQAAESAGETGWKCHHVIELDCGVFAAQPNNRVAWFDPSSVTPFDKPPAYVTMPRVWKVEDGSKWRTSDDGRMFYGVTEI